ncbi:MAG: hypothetical protein H8D45_33180 [Bacteroidetes bacterium]|nr:hypothetical protein [Bacteroidota bacterium]
MKNLTILAVLVATLLSCQKEESITPETIENTLVHTSWEKKSLGVIYTLEFTSETECKKTTPSIFFAGDVSVNFYNYEPTEEGGTITNPDSFFNAVRVVRDGSTLTCYNSDGGSLTYSRTK